jgi:pyruvate dehydrogenase E1 component alpha subunit/2-oxoisovalerate dehydrogenase E1 component
MSMDGRDFLYQMLRIRRFEEKCVELYSAEKIRGFLHLYIGEEAVAVGSISCLASDDAIVATYREHGQALVRGVSAGAIMAEMYGKLEGCARGRGGSMHLFDTQKRLYGGNAIVGGGLPLSLGLALADKMQNRQRVTCCVFGDGAVAEGEFHESMNLASLWKLPVLFLCENNLYAMGTALQFEHSVTELVKKADAYNVAAAAVDGMDVFAVKAATQKGLDYIRSGAGPYFLECRTYRFRAHSMFDAELYRSKAEIQEWKKRDPIATLSARLKSQGSITDGDIEEMERKVADEVAEAVNFAEASTWEPVEDLTRFVYSERRPS